MALHVVSNGEVASSPPPVAGSPSARSSMASPLSNPGRWPGAPRCLALAMGRTQANGGTTGPATTRQLTVLLTDGHQHDGEIRAALDPLRTRQHEVLFLHFIARDERDFPAP